MEAFILNGGRSTRMGRDKATLELGGVTLADRALTIARRSLLFSRVRSVGGESWHADLVGDVYEGRGPLGGLHAALNAADAGWIFLLGCDLPFVTHELITRLATFCVDDIDAVVPVQGDGRLQPLCGFYRVAECLTGATELLESRQSAALKELIDRVKARKIVFDEIADLTGSEHFFLNINTPADFETARRFAATMASVAK